MADRSAAEIFGVLFDKLAERADDKWVKKLAKEMWKLSWQFDFTACQMEADDALEALGLARKVTDPIDKGAGYCWQYRESDAKKWETMYWDEEG